MRTRSDAAVAPPLSADGAVQIALLNNLGLQAAYNRLGIAEAVAVKASRPPALSFCDLGSRPRSSSTSSGRSWAACCRSRPCRRGPRSPADQFEQAELRAAEETLRLAAETRRAYIRAVAARQIVAALGDAKASAEASAELAEQLKQTGAVNKLDQARRQVFATEMAAQVVGARQQAAARPRRLTRLMGLWGADLDALLPSALPQLPGSARSLGAIEQQAMDRGSICSGAARSRGARPSFRPHAQDPASQRARSGGISKTQKDRGEKSADGGGFDIAFEVPLLRFRQGAGARGRAALFRGRESARQKAVNARSEAREAFGAYKANYGIARKYEREVLPLQQTISAETELQYNAMQIDAFALLEAARAKSRPKWRASKPNAISGWPRPTSAWRCSAAEA